MNWHPARLLVREKTPQNKHLPEPDHQDDQSLANRPVAHAGVEILGKDPSGRLPQLEVSLGIDDFI